MDSCLDASPAVKLTTWCFSPVRLRPDSELKGKLPLPLLALVSFAASGCRWRLITDQRIRALGGRTADYWNISAGSLPRSLRLPQSSRAPCFRGEPASVYILLLTTVYIYLSFAAPRPESAFPRRWFVYIYQPEMKSAL